MLDQKQVSLRSKRFCGVWEQKIAARKFIFASLPIFRAGKIPKIPSNPTETLATQAKNKFILDIANFDTFFWLTKELN